jgi:hypothetical protein
MSAIDDLDDPPRGWEAVPQRLRHTLESAWDSDVPTLASAVHARWWQLETWLRSLVYVELRAAYGAEWLEIVGKTATRRSEIERQFEHMASIDANLTLTHVDVQELFDMISRDWQLFENALIDRQIWDGRVRELKQIRHRIAHCRRPHPDDLIRIEQTLRDLERGAFRALASYNNERDASNCPGDPVADGWIAGNHRDADLVNHFDRRGVRFRLAYSRRPWADSRPPDAPITGTPGYLWHAMFYLVGRYVLPNELWSDSSLDLTGTRSRLIYLSSQGLGTVNFTFPAVDGRATLADDIGVCLRSVMGASRVSGSQDDEAALYAARRHHVDPRVQVDTPWTIVNESTVPVTIFSAN